MWRLVCALVVLTAGCLDVQPAPAEATGPLQLRPSADEALLERLADPEIEWAWSLSDPLLVEVYGVEGPADWERLERIPIEELIHAAQIKFAAIQGKYLPEDMQDGDATDGVLSSWRFQYLAERDRGSFWPMAMDWSKQRGFGGLSGSHGSGEGWQVCQRPDPDAWRVEATQAAQAAQGDAAFAAHQAAHPDGEMWITLSFAPEFRRLGAVHDGCLEFRPVWHLRWMDVDLLLKDGVPWVEVHVDATKGSILATRTGTIKLGSAYDAVVLHDETHVFGATLPTRIDLGTVPAGALSLSVQVAPSASSGDATYHLEGPDGSMVYDGRGMSYRLFHVTEPVPGQWTLVRDGTDIQLAHPEVRDVKASVLA